MPVSRIVDDQIAEIEAQRPVDRMAFSASSRLGAKSLAYQNGIPAQRSPDFQAYFGGIWTLVYEARQC